MNETLNHDAPAGVFALIASALANPEGFGALVDYVSEGVNALTTVSARNVFDNEGDDE